MAPAPATRPSIRAIFESTYKGGTKRWSTRWHFTPAVNPTTAVFATLANDLDPYLAAIVTPRTSLKEYVGYYAGSEVPVWSADRNQAGTFNPGTFRVTPLESCAVTRYGTTQRTSKNHPIYLFQYTHDVLVEPSQSDYELLNNDQQENIRQLAQKWVDGFVISGSTYMKTGPYGAVAQNCRINDYISHRDFPT